MFRNIVTGVFTILVILLLSVSVSAVNNITGPDTVVFPDEKLQGGDDTDNQSSEDATIVQGELLVKFNGSVFNSPEILTSAVNGSNKKIGATVKTDYNESGMPGLMLISLPAGMNVNEGISYYESLPYVDYAEANAVYSIAASTAGNTTTISSDKDPMPSGEELLVRFNASTFTSYEKMREYADKTFSDMNATIIQDYSALWLPGLFLIKVDDMIPDEAVISLSKRDNILYVEKNSLYHV